MAKQPKKLTRAQKIEATQDLDRYCGGGRFLRDPSNKSFGSPQFATALADKWGMDVDQLKKKVNYVKD